MIDLQNYIWFISVQGFCLNIYFQYSFGTITYNFPANFLYTVQQRENPPRERRQPASGLGNCGASQDYDFCHTVYSGFLTSFNILITTKQYFKFRCFFPNFIPISRKISKTIPPQLVVKKFPPANHQQRAILCHLHSQTLGEIVMITFVLDYCYITRSKSTGLFFQ